MSRNVFGVVAFAVLAVLAAALWVNSGKKVADQPRFKRDDESAIEWRSEKRIWVSDTISSTATHFRDHLELKPENGTYESPLIEGVAGVVTLEFSDAAKAQAREYGYDFALTINSKDGKQIGETWQAKDHEPPYKVNFKVDQPFRVSIKKGPIGTWTVTASP